MIWATFHPANDDFCFLKVLFAKLWSDHSLYDKYAKSSHHIRNWLKNFEEFQFSLARVYQTIKLEMSWKKWTLKLLRTWCYTRVVTFWLRLEKVVFKLENGVISCMNTVPLWRWNSRVFLQNTASKNMRTLPLNKAKSRKRS